LTEATALAGLVCAEAKGLARPTINSTTKKLDKRRFICECVPVRARAQKIKICLANNLIIGLGVRFAAVSYLLT
jgi:hypothetical protein